MVVKLTTKSGYYGKVEIDHNNEYNTILNCHQSLPDYSHFTTADEAVEYLVKELLYAEAKAYSAEVSLEIAVKAVPESIKVLFV